MTRREKPDLTVVSEKGQVVIPAAIRVKLGIGPKTRLLVYGYHDAVILKKLEVPDVASELEALYKKVDAKIAKHGELADDEINEIIHSYRSRKQRSCEGH